MGCCVNTESGSSNSPTDTYEQMLSMQENCIKLLLLGTSGCGKTTITKQIQKINHVYQQNYHSEDNLLSLLHNTIITDIKTLCQHEQFSSTRNIHGLVEKIVALHQPYIITPTIANIIKQLYNDQSIQNILSKRYNYKLNICDNIEYFLNKIDEITMHHYIPTFEDSIRINSQTNGYSITKFVQNIDTFGKHMFEMIDVGGARNERRKWLHPKLLLDPDLNTIIYVVAISEYDMVLFEDEEKDNKTNKLIDSINAFKKIIETFENKSIILLFNKYDLFQNKIKNIPITVAFDNIPNDINPNNPDHVIKFIASQFSDVFTERLINKIHPLQIIRTVGLDTNSIEKMFENIVSQIIVDPSNNFANIKNHEIKKENVLLQTDSEIDHDGFDAPLISIGNPKPKLKSRYSTPVHPHNPDHHHLPTTTHTNNPRLPTLRETQSLPLFSNAHTKQLILKQRA